MPLRDEWSAMAQRSHSGLLRDNSDERQWRQQKARREQNARRASLGRERPMGLPIDHIRTLALQVQFLHDHHDDNRIHYLAHRYALPPPGGKARCHALLQRRFRFVLGVLS